MKSNNLVTKDFLAKEFVKFRKELREKDLKKLRKEINSDIINLVDTSIIPLLEKMSDDIKDIKHTVNIHEHRLDQHDNKFLLLAQ